MSSHAATAFQPERRIFTNKQVYQAVQPVQLAQRLREAFRDRYKDYVVPPRLNVADGDSGVLIMPCRSSRYTGVKVSTWQREHGRAPRVIKADYSLYYAATGEALFTGDADALTELRTAAMSAVATDALALPGARTLAVFGTGRLAAEHIRALKHVRAFDRVLVCGSNAVASQAFAARMRSEQDVPAAAVDATICAAEADVLCTCTTSATPLFDGRLLKPGMHINVLGAFHPSHREVDSTTVRRSRVVTDNRAGALAEAGELVIPMGEGVIEQSHVAAEIQDALRNATRVRTSSECITLYRGVGFAMEDMVAAECLLEAEPGCGVPEAA